jgi:DNA-directed RNA polymerase subunit E"
MSEKACRACNLISYGSVCPSCETTNLSDDFSGIAIIFDSQRSVIAKKMDTKRNGRFALRVR